MHKGIFQSIKSVSSSLLPTAASERFPGLCGGVPYLHGENGVLPLLLRLGLCLGRLLGRLLPSPLAAGRLALVLADPLQVQLTQGTHAVQHIPTQHDTLAFTHRTD